MTFAHSINLSTCVGGFERPAYIFESAAGTSLCCYQSLCYNTLNRSFLLVVSVRFLCAGSNVGMCLAAFWESVWLLVSDLLPVYP